LGKGNSEKETVTNRAYSKSRNEKHLAGNQRESVGAKLIIFNVSLKFLEFAAFVFVRNALIAAKMDGVPSEKHFI
jgi:hypothetical protein